MIAADGGRSVGLSFYVESDTRERPRAQQGLNSNLAEGGSFDLHSLAFDFAASNGAARERAFVSSRVAFPEGWSARFEGRVEAAALAAIGLYLGRTSGKREFSMPFAGPEQVAMSQSLAGLTAPFVAATAAWLPAFSAAMNSASAGERGRLRVKMTPSGRLSGESWI